MALSEYRTIISQSVRQMVDNNEALLTDLQPAIIQRIRDGSGYPEVDAETYATMYAERPEEIADNLRDVVQDIIVEHLDTEAYGFARDMLHNLLDLGDRGIWTDIAEAYVPDPDDYEAAL